MPRNSIEDIKKKVSVQPLASGGANFETYILIKTSKGYNFKPTTGLAIFSGIFSFITYALLFYGIFKIKQTKGLEFLFDNFVISLVWFAFFCAGNYLLYQFFKPIKFNARSRTFQKGLFKSRNMNISFDSIVALQIIGETIVSDDTSFGSFELNLVLDDASRINLIDHNKLKSVILDANTLSEFLSIPIWHAKSNES